VTKVTVVIIGSIGLIKSFWFGYELLNRDIFTFDINLTTGAWQDLSCVYENDLRIIPCLFHIKRPSNMYSY